MCDMPYHCADKRARVNQRVLKLSIGITNSVTKKPLDFKSAAATLVISLTGFLAGGPRVIPSSSNTGELWPRTERLHSGFSGAFQRGDTESITLGVTVILPGESRRINTPSRGQSVSDLPIVDERNP